MEETTRPNEIIEAQVYAWVSLKQEQDDLRQRLRNIEELIEAEMDRRGSKQLLVGGYTVSYTSKREPQHTMLQPLKEYIPEDELIANGTYFPAHERTVTQWVPAKWDMQKAKKNYLGDKAPSSEVVEVIQKAYVIHDPILRITEVKEA
jgi:hypothetical protein